MLKTATALVDLHTDKLSRTGQGYLHTDVNPEIERALSKGLSKK